MATKQDFENAARIFRAELDICAHVLHNADADPEAHERAYGSQIVIARVAVAFANQYARENGRFDRGRFYHACGLDANGRASS